MQASATAEINIVRTAAQAAIPVILLIIEFFICLEFKKYLYSSWSAKKS